MDEELMLQEDDSTNVSDSREEKTSRIPQEVTIKPAFEERYRLLLGERYDEYLKYSLSYIRKCIRVNTLKITPEEIVDRLSARWNLTPITWCPEGFFIDFKDGKRFDIGNLEEHQLGYIYVQDAASMIPPMVLDPKPNERVLDLCSAPGSKTTQIAAKMQNTGVLIANDVDVQRVKPLGMNLNRCGVTNAAIVVRANRKLPQEYFDRILVDAPCSGTGTIRRSLKTLLMWSPNLVKKLHRIQEQLVREAWAALKPGGIMVYSTCTQEPEENEAIVDFAIKELGASVLPIELNIKRSAAITSWMGKDYDAQVKECLRIYPQDNDTEGFFVAKLRKNF